MARRGRFGRRPRSTGNLTALVASLYREQRQAEDRTMFDAYENGGLVDGKPVDDARMRAYIATRRDSMGQDDPLWDEWNNRLIQLDFKIGEDKITLAFQQGKVGAGAVAAYYRKQLSSIPKESAFYREVASRAAQWAKAAGGAARGAARSRLSSALGGRQKAVAQTWSNYAQLEAIITKAARRANVIAGNQDLTNADASRLLALFDAGIPGPNGMITFEDWRQASLAAYKAFDTQIAINKQLNRGTKTLTEDRDKFLTKYLVRINAIDDRAAYEAARDNWIAAVEAAQGDPGATMEAYKAYADTLDAIRENAMKPGRENENDPEFIGGLLSEANAIRTGKATGPTVWDLMSNTGEGVVTNDAEDTAARATNLYNDAKALANGDAYLGQNVFGGYDPGGSQPLQTFGVNYFPPGASVTGGLGNDMQQAVLNLNGKSLPVWLKGKPITSVGLKGPDGEPVKAVNGIPVENLSEAQIQALFGQGYTPVEGKTVGYVFVEGKKTTYGVLMPDGSMRFTLSYPFEGAFANTNNSFLVYVGNGYDANGNQLPNAPQITSVAASASIIDDDVSPASLRDLAANAGSDAERVKYETLAEQKLRGIQNETAYMERDRKGLRPPDALFGFRGVGDALGNVQEALRNAVLTKKEDDSGPVAPPQFGAKKASGPLLPPAPPPVVPSLGGAPGAFRPPPPPKGVSPELPPGKAKDDKYQPPPPPKPKGGGQGGGKDVL